MNISMNTLMLAIKAVERDIERHEEMVRRGTLGGEDSNYYGQYILDLMQALSELGSVYQSARESHLECPTLEELMNR